MTKHASRLFFTKFYLQELVASNNALRLSSGQNEKDTHDIVLYFQREMEIKDDVILRLNEELVKCQTQLKFEVEKVRKGKKVLYFLIYHLFCMAAP